MDTILQWLCNGASSDILWLTPVLTQKFRFTQPNKLLDPHEIIIGKNRKTPSMSSATADVTRYSFANDGICSIMVLHVCDLQG